jgi:plasmid replication initiation protein
LNSTAIQQVELFQDNSLQPSNQIKVHKSFTDCQYNVSIRSIKILFGLISLNTREDNEFKTYRFTISKLADFLGLKYHNRCQDIRKTLEELQDEKVILPDDSLPLRERPVVHWLSRCQVAESKDFVELKLNPELAELFLGPEIDKNYIASIMVIILQMGSTYSTKMYMLLKKYIWVQNGQIKHNVYEESIEGLKFKLGIPLSKYPKSANFKAKILATAQEECKKYSDIIFDLEPIMKGKTTIGFRFIISKNPDYKAAQFDLEPIGARTTGMERYNEIIDKAIANGYKEAIRQLIRHKMSKSGIAEVVELCSPQELLSVIHEIESFKDIQNISGKIRNRCREIDQDRSSGYNLLLAEEVKRQQQLEAENELKKAEEQAAADKKVNDETERDVRIKDYLQRLGSVEFDRLIEDFKCNASEILRRGFNKEECLLTGKLSHIRLVEYISSKLDSGELILE